MSTIDKILQLVEESGLTAKEYAINAGLGAGNITDWKTGRSKPSVESLQKIAKYAGVQLEWLTGDSPYKNLKSLRNALVHQYNDNLYNIDLVNSILSSSLFFINSALVPEDRTKIIKFLEKNNAYEILPNKVEEFVRSFPAKKQASLRQVLNGIIEDMKSYKQNREDYLEFKMLFDVSPQFFSCPIYRQNKCRTTQLGGGMLGRIFTN